MSYPVPSVKVWLTGDDGEVSSCGEETEPGNQHYTPQSTDNSDSLTENECTTGPVAVVPATTAAALGTDAANVEKEHRGLGDRPLAAESTVASATTTCRLLEGRSASLSESNPCDILFADDQRALASERSLSLCTDRFPGSLFSLLMPSLPVAEQLSVIHRLLAEEVNTRHEHAARDHSSRDAGTGRGISSSRRQQEPDSDDSGSQLLDPEDLAVLRRSSAVSLFSQMCNDSDALAAAAGVVGGGAGGVGIERRESLFVVKDGVDELRYTATAIAPERLTLTQQLAFPTLAAEGQMAAAAPAAGGRIEVQARFGYNEAEYRMNTFAKLITGLVLALVAALLATFFYRAFS